MAARRTTFDKIQRERAKKAKAAAKRERRQSRSEGGAVATEAVHGPAAGGGEDLTAPQLLERIEALHRRYEAGGLDLETFEEERAELYERLSLLPMD
ncbi:MAG: hypothetical protein KJ056_04165 [Acidimicrobiia bacterium]|nr:hypothetical protein [Acidimicrobiia bacterium]MCL4292208.1 hypothetical protein [Acidimicrobiia bacterium]